MKEQDPSMKEKSKLLIEQILGKQSDISKAGVDWDKLNVGPMSWVFTGRPKFILPLFATALLFLYVIVVQVINWDTSMRLAVDEEFIHEIDFVFLELINAPVPYVLFAACLLAACIAMYLHLNTWGSMEFQVEPAIIETQDGKIVTAVLRVLDYEEIWPVPKGSDLEEYLEELIELELAGLLSDYDKEADTETEVETKEESETEVEAGS